MLPSYLQGVSDKFLSPAQRQDHLLVDVVGSGLTLGLFSGGVVHVLGFFWKRFWFSGVGCNIPVCILFSQCLM